MYQALYRKYRPTNFKELLGQDQIVNILTNQLKTGDISHAYLFTGTRGTGKTSAAKIFARAVNCLSEGEKPCNECVNCVENLKGSSIDIIEIDAASNNGVDNIRDLKDRAFYQPASQKYKVYIIDEVHMLSKGAFNALLKILEEPPKHLIFILATTEPERLPMTILSRCQKYQFNRINKDIIAEKIIQISNAEGVQIDERTAKLIAENSEGSMRDALSVLDQLLTSGEKNIDYEKAIEVLGVIDEKRIFSLVRYIIEKDINKILTELDFIIAEGKDVEQLLKDIISHFRNLMIAKTAPKSIEKFVYSNQSEYLNQAESLELNFIIKAIEVLIEYQKEFRLSQEQRVLLEIAILKIVNLSVDEKRPAELKIENKKSNFVERKAPEPKEIKTEEKISDKKPNEDLNVKPKGDIDIGKIKSDWSLISGRIGKVRNFLGRGLAGCTILSYENNILKLKYKNDNKFLSDLINKPENIEIIEKEISMFYNESIKVDFFSNNEKIKQMQEKDIQNLEKIFGKDFIEIN